MGALTDSCAIVVIGRNEGPRLKDTLQAAQATGLPVTYADSRSSDGSADLARSLGVDVVEMAEDEPLGAGRARNLGARHLLAQRPATQYVQFVDGDCLLDPGWIPQAVAALDDDPTITAVCGWRLEAEPRRNIYHRMAHMEWQMGSVGDIPDFAGEVMIRAAAFVEVGGYDPRVVAGEDTELSSRLREAGGRIRRIDALCTLHDIDMSTARQWWKRGERCGYGYTEIAMLHRKTDQLFLREATKTLLWGALAPLTAVALLRWTRVPLILVCLRFIVSTFRAARSVNPPGAGWGDRLVYGVGCSVGPLPGAIGATKYIVQAAQGRHPSLIEYKDLGTESRHPGGNPNELAPL